MTLLAQAVDQAAGDTAEIVLFWVFAVLALGSAIAVITMRNIVHGALMLVINFLAIAGLYLTLQSAFLSIIQVLVYAGAIMVLFLFVIMLLGIGQDELLVTRTRTRVLAVAAGGLVAAALTVSFVGPYTSDASICGQQGVVTTSTQVPCRGFDGVYDADDAAGAAFLGRTLFTRYTFPFELSALLLTVATIGAVILARRRDLAPEDEDDADGDDPTPAVPGGAYDEGHDAFDDAFDDGASGDDGTDAGVQAPAVAGPASDELAERED